MMQCGERWDYDVSVCWELGAVVPGPVLFLHQLLWDSIVIDIYWHFQVQEKHCPQHQKQRRWVVSAFLG